MQLRSLRERILQTVCFEAGGLILVTPLYMMVFGRGSAESLGLLVAISLAVMLWTPLFNTVFDAAEGHLTGRLASDRPPRLRVVHALLHEVSTVAVTLPVLVWLGGHGLVAAIAIDLVLSAAYAAYAYGFYLAYDRLRPMAASSSPRG